MAHAQSTAKVGAVVILFMALMGAVVYFFVGRGTGGYPVDVSFKDAQGIKQEAEVRLAGVKIGAVKDIDVDASGRRALLHLRIFPKQSIPEGSKFTITSGGLLGEYFVQIIAPQTSQASEHSIRKTGSPPPYVKGTDLPTFDELKEQVANLGKGGQDIVENLKVATKSLADLSNDPVLQRSLKNTAVNVETISRQATFTAARLNSVIDEQLPMLRRTLHNVELTTGNVEASSRNIPQVTGNANRLIKNASDLVTSLGETNTFLRETVKNTLEQADAGPSLHTTVANMAAASEQFKQIAADARKITDDLARTNEAGDTRIGQVVGSVGKVADRASTLLDKLTGVTDKAGRKRGRLIDATSQVDVYQRLKGDNPFRLDANLSIARGPKSDIIVGLRDIGESNKLNLQNSVLVNPHVRMRYGFHASKLGLGTDFNLKPAGGEADATSAASDGITVDLFDPNRHYLDIFGRKQVNDKMGVIIGFEDILHESRPTVGLTYRP